MTDLFQPEDSELPPSDLKEWPSFQKALDAMNGVPEALEAVQVFAITHPEENQPNWFQPTVRTSATEGAENRISVDGSLKF